MASKSEAESMQELTSLMWNRYLKERVHEEQNHEMNAYKAEVVTNHGDGTLTVQRPFESVTLRLKAASSITYAQPGDMVLVVGIGDKSKALSNAFVLCKTDLLDDAHVPVYGLGKNLLDNWYFVGGGGQQGGGQFPINQRGQTSYTGAVYTIDRWKGSNNYGSSQIDSTGLTVIGSTNFHALNQRIENGADLLNGRTVTISALLTNGKLITGTVTIKNLTSSDRNYIAVWDDDTNANGGILIFASTSDVTFSVRGLSGKSFSVVAVKMELGTRQTLAHQENGDWVLNELPNYEEELAKCQRYLFVVAPNGNPYGFSAFGNGRSGGAVVILSTPVTMRSASPTVTYSGPWSVIDRITDTPIAISSITYPRLSTNAISFIANFTGAVAGKLYEFFANNDSNAKLIVSCEI